MKFKGLPPMVDYRGGFSHLIGDAYDLLAEVIHQENIEEDVSLSEMCSDPGKVARSSRLAVVQSCLALEMALNCLLLYKNGNNELERLRTKQKIHILSLAFGVSIDKGDQRYCQIQGLINARNNLVHPKPSKVTEGATDSYKYHLLIEEMNGEDARRAVGACVNFLSWFLFDVLQLEKDRAVWLINTSGWGMRGSMLSLVPELGHDSRCLYCHPSFAHES